MTGKLFFYLALLLRIKISSRYSYKSFTPMAKKYFSVLNTMFINDMLEDRSDPRMKVTVIGG